MNKKIDISVVISVKNEELNILKCLQRLNRFSEIIVVDSSSTDRTPEIAKSFGARLINFKWNGKFPKKRNWTLENVDIKNEWVLFLDADEFLTQEFINEISHKTKDDIYSGFTINFENYFMDKKLNFGSSFKKNALFKKSKGRYEKIDEDMWSHLDMEVHEHPIIDGKIGVIKSKIIHKDFKTLEHYISKHNDYSSWEAHRIFTLKKDKNLNLNTTQKIKYFLISTGIAPAVYFFVTYFLMLGFLDGKEGYYFAKYKSFYFFQIITKINELKKDKN